MSSKEEMPFLAHLEIFRKHIIRAAISVVACAITAGIFHFEIMEYVLLGPSKPDFVTFRWMCEAGNYWGSDVLCIGDIPLELQNRKPFGQLAALFSLSIIFGLITSFPFVFHQIWSFVKPGLYTGEKRTTRFVTFFVSLLFFMGVTFAYYIIIPLAINFLTKFQIHYMVDNVFDVTSFINFILMVTVATGLMFQLPIAVFYLSKVGIVTPKLMKAYQKHAIVVILLVAAIITPPDAITQIGIGIPIFGLYLISIKISARVEKKRLKELKE